MRRDEVLPKLQNVKRNSNGWSAQCPAHNDQRNSLSVSESDGKILLHCHAGCSFESICGALKLEKQRSSHVTATYDYVDEQGELRYQVCRTVPKSFFRRRPDGKGGFIFNTEGVPRLLYKLPELLTADLSAIVFIPEGEKDVDALRELGQVATCNPGGAGKWRDEYSETLRGRHVVILPDNDKTGRDHAEGVARSLLSMAESIKIVELPGLAEKGDVSDWLKAGGTIEGLLDLIEDAPLYVPTEGTSVEEAQGLIVIAREADLFHTSFGDAYATFKTPQGHLQTCAVDSQEFRQWLTYRCWQTERRTPRKEDINTTINAAQGLARYEGQERPVHTRLAAHAGVIYLDLCDKEHVVQVSSDGWQIINADDAPVRFRRAKGLQPLPSPIAGGDVKLLRRFVNLASDEDFILLVAWLVAALRGDAMKFPVLSLTGEQGSAKSTVSLMLRMLIDPNVAPLRNSVRNQWDATIAANNSWCVILNNLSELPQWLSDTLCCIADGIGFAARTHHTMTEETLFQAARPIILNGITDIATRADLLDRSVCLHLPAISKEKRVDDAVLFSEFEQARPLILGSLLNGVCAALRNLPHVHLKKLPRMADFAKWATAAESGLGFEAGAFMAAYNRNRNAASESALEASPVATVLLSYVRERGEVTVSLTTLLSALGTQFSEGKVPSDFPKSTNKLAAELRRCMPHLRAAGLTIADAGREGGKGSKMMTFSFG
jgi:hypothetical protein